MTHTFKTLEYFGMNETTQPLDVEQRVVLDGDELSYNLVATTYDNGILLSAFYVQCFTNNELVCNLDCY